MAAEAHTAEQALLECRRRFAKILDKYNVSPEDRQLLNDIELEFFEVKNQLLTKLDHVMQVLEEAPK